MHLEEYALLGDCHTAALVSRAGSIDWLCWPNFGADACFAKLLGTSDNGYWSLHPTTSQVQTSRRYVGDTFVLETTHTTRSGTVVVTDFMPPRPTLSREPSQVVRIVRGVRGAVKMGTQLKLRFSYGQTIPWVTRIPHGIRAVAGPDSLEMQSNVPLHGEDHMTAATFTAHAGKTYWFVMTCGEYANYREQTLPRKWNVHTMQRNAANFWNTWAKRCTYTGPYRDKVMRSLLVLKALTYAPTGGIVAAPTTSLPEQIGGGRNWDYRYCWLRDTTFTIYALNSAGYQEEAHDWIHWLRRTIAGDAASVQIMYGIHGERSLPEREITHLRGYEGSAPVRVGNDACGQLQLDIYGEVLAAFAFTSQGQRKISSEDFHLLKHLIEHLETIWDKPDQGIWETRSGPQYFVYSKVMAWLAFDRAIILAERGKHDAPVDRWRAVRDKLHRQILKRGFNKRRNSFMQAYGSSEVDASCLLIPLVGFLPIDDPRVQGTIAAVEKELLRQGFVKRYRAHKGLDGLKGGEGEFLACSFWLASCYRLMGRDAEAVEMFDRLLKLTNDLGLLAEEYDVRRKRQVGNYPQAFSHIALVGCAYRLLEGGQTPLDQRKPAPKKSPAPRR